ncbi:MAG: single-stranded DNA-binding protein [Acidimicrobiales bacterium]
MATKTSTRSTKSTPETTDTKRSSKGTSVNRVTLVGRVVAAPQLRTTGSGISVTTIRIATNDRDVPEFHDVVLWRQQAEFAAKYMAKGRLAYVEGRLQSRTWEGADGSKRRVVEVVADRFQAMSPKQAAEAAA